MNAEAAIPLALGVSPSGELHLEAHPAEIVPGQVARQLLLDFELGPAHALLQLAARHPGEPLPPSLGFFRDVGTLYLSALCRQRSPAPPGKALEQRATSVEKSTTILRSPEDLYRYWRNFDNLPSFMKHLANELCKG